MKRAILVVCLLGIAACSPMAIRTGPAEAYLSVFDRLLVRTQPFSSVFALPCPHWDMKTNDWAPPLDRCFRMLPARRWRGVWIDMPRQSFFLPGADEVPSDTPETGIWLSFAQPSGLERPADAKTDTRAYRVEFVGRRTQYAGEYGESGTAIHEILVDRVISAVTIKQ